LLARLDAGLESQTQTEAQDLLALIDTLHQQYVEEYETFALSNG
jgi:hypothetical protein